MGTRDAVQSPNQGLHAAMTAEIGDKREDLAGLALSGGGIRSATFNLGLLQGLDRLKLLDCFDYLSTVSGGGYIGAFWTAWRSRNGDHQASFPGADLDGTDGPAVCHLRRFSNFLTPRLGMFSYDTGRAVVAILAGLIPSIAASFALLILAIFCWQAFAWPLASSGTRPAALVLADLTLGVMLLCELRLRCRESLESVRHNILAVIVTMVTAGVWLYLLDVDRAASRLIIRYPVFTAPSDLDATVGLAYPALAWGATFAVFAAVRGALSRFASTPSRVAWRAALDRVLSRLVLLMSAWSLLAALWILALLLCHDRFGFLAGKQGAGWYGIITGSLTGAFIWVRKHIAQSPSEPAGRSLRSRFRPLLPKLLAYAVVLLLVVALMVIMIDHAANWPWLLAGAVVTWVLILLTFHPNRVGLHAFYRSRLARAYLGASNPELDPDAPRTEEHERDDIYLKDLAAGRPFHLVCCTANDLSPDEPLLNLQRGAQSAVLSKAGFWVGQGPWLSWNGSCPTLGSAMTASAAAFNPMMGPYSKRLGSGAVFLMAMLNLRLGLWLRHPAGIERGRKQSAKEWAFPGFLFLKELLGISSASGSDVHLSDGGHFDNSAIYELIRRRCRYIVASDCGADPEQKFDDIANLVRRVRTDFGVEVRIDLSPLHTGSGGHARQSMIAGDIDYPDAPSGVLFLFKPTLVGNEPVDVTQYKARNPAFPNETTGDQFYDEAQWESYRRLGEHAAENAFSFLAKSRSRLDPRTSGALSVQRLFARSRFEWLPRPEGLEARVAQFAVRAAELDIELCKLHGGSLFREVYKEIPELERQFANADEPPAPRDLLASGDDLNAAHRVIRQAILLMEEVYEAWDLETTYNQPYSLGVMNYFGRWAQTRMLRMWWPVVKAMYSQPFTRFMERQFGLRGIEPLRAGGRACVRVLEPGETGFAHAAWTYIRNPAMAAKDEPAGQKILGYWLGMFYDETREFTAMAGVLRAFQEGDRLWWDAEDFFVPPGLWGIGIGEDFLDRLTDWGRQAGVNQFQVRLRPPAEKDAASRKQTSDQSQLYRAARFRDDHARGLLGEERDRSACWLSLDL